MHLRRFSQLGNKKNSLWKTLRIRDVNAFRTRISQTCASPTVHGSCFNRWTGAFAREFEAELDTTAGNCQSLLFVTVDPTDRILLRLPRRRLLYRRAPLQSFLSGASMCPPVTVAADAAASSSPCPLPRAHPPIHFDNKKRRKSLPTPSLPPSHLLFSPLPMS